MRREQLPSRHECETFKVKVGSVSWFINLGFFPDGRIGEVNLNTAKAGSEMNEMMHMAGIITSLALQHGATSKEIAGLMRYTSDNHVMQAIAGVLEKAEKQ